MGRVVLVLVVAVALLSGSASASDSALTAATLRIAGNGPLSVVGSGWESVELVVVKTHVRGITKTARPHADRAGYWRIVVRTGPIDCGRVVVTAHGPRTGTLTARRMFGACQPVAP